MKRVLHWVFPSLLIVDSTIVWRLRKADTLLLQWRVFEMELMSDTACSGGILQPQADTAVVVSQNVADGEKAFDGSTATAWTSGACTISCYVGRTYPLATVARCVRLFQDSDRSFSAYTVSLEYSTTGVNGFFTSTASYTFLAGGIWLQLDNLWQSPGLRTRWRIANTAVIKSSWRIMEFRLFSDSSCEVLIPHDVPLSSDYSSSDDPLSALDGDLTTSWTSPCALGGCPSFSAWIGVHLPRDIPTVMCMKLFQSANPNEYTTNLAVQFWDGIATWTTFRTFANLLGGMELFLSGMFFKTAWRVTNGAPTNKQVQINEARFFYDAQCDEPVIKEIFLTTEPRIKALSSPRAVDSSDVSSVFDGVLSGPGWKSECTICNPNEVYVGIQATDGESREISCVKVFMESGSSVRELQVQFIGTIKWEVLYNVVYASGGYWMSLTSLANRPILPSRIYPLYDNPLYRVRVIGEWSEVLSIAFFPNAECRGSPISGSPIASVGVESTEPVFPFQSSSWQAATPDGWIGVVVLDKDVIVACVQISERKRRAGESKLITLEQLAQWPAETFTPVQTFLYDHISEADSETLLQIGYEAGTLWRLRRADSFAGIPSGANWRISELRWFSSPDCGGDSAKAGVLLGSSVLSIGATDLGQSVDGDLETYWQPAIADFNPWLGVSFGTDPVVVGCVKLFQPIDSVFAARTIKLETSDPLSRSWVLVRQINFLSGGLWQTLTSQFTLPAPGSLWRVVNIAPMGKRLFWQVRDLRLFRDMACTQLLSEADAGVAVASGYSGNNAPTFSDGASESSQWAAQCDYCSSYQAWVGILLEKALTAGEPGCAEVLTNVGLDVLKWDIEKFTGQTVPGCVTDPSQRSCWTALGTATRKSCVYTADPNEAIVCNEIAFVRTTPKPETLYVEAEKTALVLAAWVAPICIGVAIFVCCWALLTSPKEEKRPVTQLFVYPTYIWFLFWVAIIIVLVLLAFWLVSMLLMGLFLSIATLGSLLMPVVLFERTKAKKYEFAAGRLPKSSLGYFVGIFTVQQVFLCLFDVCLFRVTSAYLGIGEIHQFISWLIPFCESFYGVVQFTSPVSFRCGGTSLIFAAGMSFAAISVLFIAAAYDAFAITECSNTAALLSRKRLVYTGVSFLTSAFFAVLQVVALGSAGALYHGFVDAGETPAGCRKESLSAADPVAAHAPAFLHFFGNMSLWVVTILMLVPVVVTFLSGHFFPSGIDPRLADFLGVPELGSTEKVKVEDISAVSEESATARSTFGRKKSTLGMEKEDESSGTQIDAIFHVVSDIYASIFSSLPIIIGRAVLGPFRIHERAKLHTGAFQLSNVALLPVQRATVRLISLVWQSIPVGIFVGKLAEYMCIPPVRTSVASFPGFARSVAFVQWAGLGMYLCVVISGFFVSGVVSAVFLFIALAFAVFRANFMASWVITQPEPSLAPGNAAEVDAAEQPQGNEVVVIGNASIRAKGSRSIRFLGDN